MTYIARNELRGYAESDWDVIDYKLWRPQKDCPPLRGPEVPLVPRGYVVALGAAQTFGRFCESPYPTLLAADLGIPVLNLGFAGAGPRFFMRKSLLDLIKTACCAIIQVFSGRSLSNSVFECPNDGGTLRRRDQPNTPAVFALDAWNMWMTSLKIDYNLNDKQRIDKIRSLADENRTLWAGEMAILRSNIKVPILLFWFSKREMDYQERYSDAELVFGEFPHLINAATMRAIAPLFQATVETVSEVGSPQPLFNRFTGEKFCINPTFKFPFHNMYYPSPEMHLEAARALAKPIKDLLLR